MKNLILLLFISVFIYSCQTEDFIDNENENLVSIEQATDLASMLEYKTTSVSGRVSSTTKEIKNVIEIPDNNGNPSFYIVNYQESGYIIISADNRIEPIRAFSTDENFSTDFENYPNGLVEWLAGTSSLIDQVRLLNLEQTDAIAEEWNTQRIQKIIQPTHTYDGCQNEYQEYGPLMTTVWGQWGGYNDLAPKIGCNNADGRAPTGCVATAMAQIMNYYEFPTNYNYANMPDTWGTISTARLMRDAADAVNMDWGCEGSSADTEGEVASSFRNDFGYSSATYSDYNHNIVKDQIRSGRPVILRGGTKGKWFIFPVYKGGHAWVCDGYKRWVSCETGISTLYLHMNWGWSSRTLNGWFAYNNWSVNGNDFNYKKGMVYNINPQ